MKRKTKLNSFINIFLTVGTNVIKTNVTNSPSLICKYNKTSIKISVEFLKGKMRPSFQIVSF